MKILHVNTYDYGGAGKACVRLHEGLIKQGVDSDLLVLYRSKNNFQRVCSYTLEQKSFFKRAVNKIVRLISGRKSHLEHIKNRPEGYEWFTSVRNPYDITRHPLYRKADIIHLHWIGDFLDFKSFFRYNKKKIVWTMQDMNPMTGGCHYSSGCMRFKSDCHDCPQLKGTMDVEYAKKNLALKKKSIDDTDIHIIASSNWLINLSKTSHLFSGYLHSMIYNGSDSTIFYPIEKEKARKLLDLPKNKIIVLFIANLDNKRKGYYFVREAYKMLMAKRDDVFLCIAGDHRNTLLDIPNCKFLGQITDEEKLNIFYSSGDVLLIPSLEDDLPNTIIESFLCGLPVIGFPVGGIKEMIVNGKNGYLCTEIGVQQLVNRIEEFLSKPDDFSRDEIRKEAIEKFPIELQVKKYMELYNNLLAN